jgi:hypothetical protein
MHHDPNAWRRLNPETIAQLPESAAVFEVANLVRTVQIIGTAEGNLRSRIAALAADAAKLPASTGGYYLRYQPADSEPEALEQRLAAYRAFHRGSAPGTNRDTSTVLRVASRRAA